MRTVLCCAGASPRVCRLLTKPLLPFVPQWDDETDMSQLEACVRSVQLDGLTWGGSKLVPVGYGIRKLQIQCVVEDDKVGTDLLEEEITKFEEHVSGQAHAGGRSRGTAWWAFRKRPCLTAFLLSAGAERRHCCFQQDLSPSTGPGREGPPLLKTEIPSVWLLSWSGPCGRAASAEQHSARPQASVVSCLGPHLSYISGPRSH